MSVSDRISKLTPEQRAVLRAKLQRKVEGDGDIVLSRRPDLSEWPLSFAQERFWLLERMEPGPLYNNYAAYRFSGPLDAGLLQQSFGLVAARHEALRATFPAVEGQPVQAIVPFSARLPLLDLSALPPAAGQAEARRIAAEEVQTAFDLAAGPLFRVRILRTAPEEHVLVLNFHHIVCDGWSANLLFRELGIAYEALRCGEAPRLPELPVQYADFAHWQRQWLRGGVLSRQLEHWKRRLDGAIPTLDLPVDRQRSKVHASHGGRLFFGLPRDLAVRFSALARREGVTPFMAQLAAVLALLYRYSGQTDLSLGTPVAGRNRVEVEPLIGTFVNTLVLRTDLSGDPTFRGLLGRARETVVDAFAHQDLPFEKLVEEVQPDRRLSQAPLFQVMFASQVSGGPETQGSQAGDVGIAGVPVDNFTTKFDLTFQFWDVHDALAGWIELDASLFDRTTVQRMTGHLETLIGGGTADPGLPLSLLPLMTEAEGAQTLREWNDTRTAWPVAGDGTLDGLFAVQAECTPEAPALVFGGETLSYAEARRRSGSLARRLRSLGVGPDVRVGVCLERAMAMPLALLAVLRAGGAFVPLDPANPPERLAFMLESSAARVLLTRREIAAGLPLDGVDVLFLEDWDAEGWEDGDGLPDPQPETDRRHLAYVVYTSGTTGRPKGIAMAHRAVVNLVRWHTAFFGPGHRVLGFAAFGFDVFPQELFAALSTGGSFHLVPDAARRDVAQLARLLEGDRIEEMILPVVVLQQLVEHCAGREETLASLRRITSAGEAMKVTPEIVRTFERFAELGIPCTLHNFYGPSESHGITGHTLHGPPSSWPESPPVGRTVPNDRIWLLDRAGRPVPIGVPGELFVGGEDGGQCLARGYTGQPALSARTFVPDPLGSEVFPGDPPGGRLYRSGDLARWKADGTIDFLGRMDHQVKIRGFRIEPGEIEAALVRQPAVQEAVVLALGEGTGKRLVAFVVPERGEKPSPSDLRTALGSTLPDAMVPSLFVLLDALPLTPNGKVNRRALEVLAAAPEETTDETPFTAPRGPVEESLAVIWEEVLGLEKVSVDAGFFELGGHSLLATRLLSRVERAFGIELPLRELFENPTVAELAGKVRQARRGEVDEAVPPIVPVPRDPRGEPLSFAQSRLWFLDRLQPGGSAYNIPTALRLQGDGGGNHLDVPALTASLAEIVRRHESLRTTFQEVEGEPVQRIARSLWEAQGGLPVFDLSGIPSALREAEARRLASDEAARPFDLAAGPLLRVLLVRLAPDDHLLLATIHHIISDAWSMEVLVRETAALYTAFSQGLPSPLPPLPVQYADFAHWQRSWLTDEALARELAWWREKLSGAPPALDLSSDRPHPPVESHRGAARFRSLPDALSRELRAIGRREAATPFTLLLAAFEILLARHSGQDDFCIGTPVAGRDRFETEGLIGFFVNTLVLRSDLSGDPTFREQIGRIRETVLDAHAHADLPFEKLVEELQPERMLDRPPLFQVMFGVQPPPREALDLPGIRLSPVYPEVTATKAELILTLLDTGDAFLAGAEYRTDLFDAPTIDRLLLHFEALLDSAAAEPDRPVSELPLLSDAERHQALREWNDVAALLPAVCLHERFEAQAARTPEALALIQDGKRWTYAELDRRADAWAADLRAKGVRPESRVAISLPRTPDLIAAILGVLKAGGAYVPIDPSYPAERRDYLLADSEAVLLVSGPLPEAPPAPRVPSPAVPGNLAYVIYTSGSTGRPKGVQVTHANVSRLFDATWGRFHFGPGDVWTLFHSYAFDFSVWEIWGALFYGGRLVIVPDEVSRSPEAFYRLLAEERVTVLNQTPSAFRPLIWAEGSVRSSESLPPLELRLVILAGEALEYPALAPWFERHGDRRPEVINLYGITETTVHSTWRRVRTEDLESPIGSRIGRALPNLSVRLLDRHFQPVPVGAPAEIHVGGAGNARGYLGRPALTAERFVPDPFGLPGERLYRSGDLARHRPDGDLEYLGRIDQQVKVRGFRIELGEIEAALLRAAGVHDAAVIAHDAGPAGTRLTAFVALGPASSAAHLRHGLETALPDFMVPSAIVELESLPLTPNGKVDRRALARLAADPGRTEISRAYVPPRDALELGLAQLWEELLGVRPVGIRDSFFALGGHSLLTVLLIARIRERFGKELPLAALFRGDTVEQMAALLRSEGALAASSASSTLVEIRQGGSRSPLFLVHPAGGNVLCYAGLAAELDAGQPVYGIQSPGLEGEAEPLQSIEEMAERYLEEIRSVQPHGPYHLGGWSLGGLIAFEMARRLEEKDEVIGLLVLLDTAPPGGYTDPGGDAGLLLHFAHDLARLLDRSLPEVVLEELQRMDVDAGLRRLLELAGETGLLPPGLDLPRGRQLFGVFRANYEAALAYRGGPYEKPLLLLVREGGETQAAAWSGQAPASERFSVSGDHYALLRPPVSEKVAQLLGERLRS